MATDLDLTFNTPNGFLKTTFNTLPVPPETLPQDIGVSVVIRSDNRIVMGGYSQYTAGSYISLSCYNTDGSLYTTFGVGGKVLLPAPSGFFTSCIVHDVILQPNDYIIVTGDTSSLDPALQRPGRFDHKIEVSLPNLEVRKEIVKIHLKNVSFQSFYQKLSRQVL
jgi:hypothetical protein